MNKLSYILIPILLSLSCDFNLFEDAKENGPLAFTILVDDDDTGGCTLNSSDSRNLISQTTFLKTIDWVFENAEAVYPTLLCNPGVLDYSSKNVILAGAVHVDLESICDIRPISQMVSLKNNVIEYEVVLETYEKDRCGSAFTLYMVEIDSRYINYPVKFILDWS